MKYRQRYAEMLEIEAFQYNGTTDDIPEWGKDALTDGLLYYNYIDGKKVLNVINSCGTTAVYNGDYVINCKEKGLTVFSKKLFELIFQKYKENDHKKNEKREKMTFPDALKLMKNGYKVKLPSWGGYWFWSPVLQTVMMHTKDGNILDIRETDRTEYTLLNVCSDEWMIADCCNCPELGGENTFSFSDAIKYMKRGFKVKRKGWNGKNQYIELAKNISYVNPKNEVINADHDAIGNQAIAFVGTSGIQLGWLASQSDMLAEDWVFVE